MSAPTHTTRVEPTGSRLDDGYRTLITFAVDPDIKIWEKTVTPPGFDGGDPINTTTMHNDDLRTFSPRALSTMTGSKMTVAYDPAAYPQIQAIINVATTVTVAFPNGTKLSFYGFLQTFETGDMAEGAQPEATCVIGVTNQDPSSGAEENPVYGT